MPGSPRDAILLVTASYDLSAQFVEAALRKRGARTFRFDTDRFPSAIEGSLDEEGRLLLRSQGQQVSSDDVSAVWYRRRAAPLLPDDIEPAHAEFAERESRAFITGALLCLDSTRRWVSDPTNVWRAEKKPFQLRVATSIGFDLPRTRITNDPTVVRTLAAETTTVAKAVSSGFISRDESFETIFTSTVSDQDLLDLSSLTIAPVTFQEHLQKRSDIRVTVVGDEAFAAEIESQAFDSSRVDWRAAEDPRLLMHREHQLPLAVEAMCHALVDRLGLRYGAIDLVRAIDGRYYFLEINPNGEWLWLQDALGWPIADRIAAELLA